MKKKNDLLLEELVSFKSKKEKETLELVIAVMVFLLISTSILTFISEEVFQWEIISWSNYLFLFLLVCLFTPYLIFSFVKNFKIWLVKYLAIIFLFLAVGGWIYFTDPQYTMPLFFWFIICANFLGLIFYDTKTLLFANFSVAICIGLLFLHYLRMNVLFSAYEVILTCIIFILTIMISFFFIKRTNIFLIELLEKRRELEEAKTALEIKVKARTKELEELAENLEAQVKERTKQLQKRVSELESFQKLTVGREVKMVELKKEIEKLKKEERK